jgi:hypothetical protein
MDKRREDFEKWAISYKDKHGLPLFVFYKKEDGSYLCQQAKLAWAAYNAALDSRVVELPSEEVQQFTDEAEYMNGYESGYLSALDQCKESLTKAGIKYK